MTSLLDRPDEPTQALLRVVAEGRARGTRWPIWQWVTRELTKSGLDAQEILDAMPVWRTGTSEYRSIRSPGVGRLLQPSSPVHLTMHGLVHCDVPATAESSIAVVLGLIAAGLAAQRSTVADSPTSLVSVVFTRDEVAAVAEPVFPTAHEEIFHLLQAEPDLNAVVGGVDDQVPWTWDVTSLPLHRYSRIGAGQDYLAALDARLQETAALAPIPVLPPLALPDAFDHLNLTWRLLFRGPLVKFNRAAIPARLTQQADSFEEFQSRCSALADLMDAFDVQRLHGEGGGTLEVLQRQIADRIDTKELPEPLSQAVTNLRSIVAIRDDLQHSKSQSGRPGQARILLGLGRYGSDWAQQWELIRGVTVDALRTIREHLDPFIP